LNRKFFEGRMTTILLSVTLLVILLLVGCVPKFLAPAPNESRQVVISYDIFKRQVAGGNVVGIISTHSTGDFIDGNLLKPIIGLSSRVKSTRFRTTRPTFEDPELAALLSKHPIVINGNGQPPTWDIVLSSGLFSTLSAVLAGFVFIALIGILTIPPGGEGKPRPSEPLIPLLQSFTSLVLSSFLWGVLAGGGTAQNRVTPLIEGFCLSWVFALGVVQTAVGIAWVLKVYLDHDSDDTSANPISADTVVNAGRWVVHFAVGLAAVSTAGVLTQSLYVLAPNRGVYDAFAWFLIAVPMIVVPVGWGLTWASRVRNETDFLAALTILALLGITGVTVLYLLITAILPDFLGGRFQWYFAGLLAIEFSLGALFTAYETALPRPRNRSIKLRTTTTKALRQLVSSR
jgi:hypothetical protein